MKRKYVITYPDEVGVPTHLMTVYSEGLALETAREFSQNHPGLSVTVSQLLWTVRTDKGRTTTETPEGP